MLVNNPLILTKENVTKPEKQFEQDIICNPVYQKNFIQYNGNIYYAKNTRFIANELIGEYISKYFNLQTINNIIAQVEEEVIPHRYCNKVLLTELFTSRYNQYYQIDTFDKVKFYDNIGLRNLNNLEIFNGVNLTKENLENLTQDLKKLIIRDFMTNQRDRHKENFIFEMNSSKEVKLCPVYDYEHSFGVGTSSYSRYFNIFNFDLNDKKVLKFILIDIYLQELLHMAMDLKIEKILSQIEQEHDCTFFDHEKEKYKKVIHENQKSIKNKRLIKRI